MALLKNVSELAPLPRQDVDGTWRSLLHSQDINELSGVYLSQTFLKYKKIDQPIERLVDFRIILVSSCVDYHRNQL